MTVEVRFISLDVDSDRYLAFLSPDECHRAARFRFDVHRNRYIVCRGTLRELLGAKLGIDPAELRFEYGSHGKPRTANSQITFNVSHSDVVAMIATAKDFEVGCDVEKVEPKFADDQIPERFFSPHEVAELRALPKAEQTAAFFRCWTRKEAFIKACGLGVSMGLDTFDVTLGEPAMLLRGADGWTLQAVAAPEGYMAAVVARGEFTIVRAPK